MLNHSHGARIGVVFCALFLARCSLVDERGQKGTNTGLIVTPVASYSTFKARNLAQKYKDNLERVVVEVVRNPTTGKLQFANNIASSGGIGFFAHSASTAVDERYLEVIVAVPEVFDEAAGLDSKIDRLLLQYGAELLEILLKDSAIYGDPDVAGYGLNFSWRSLLQGQTGSQVIFERSVLYFKKDEARKFLDHKLTKEAFLSGAAIFAMRGDALAQQVAYANREGAPVTSITARQETPAESTIAALKAGVTEKDISSEKDSGTGGNEPQTSPKSTADKKAQGAGAPHSDGAKKQSEASGVVGKKVPETSGSPAGMAVKEKTGSTPATGGVEQSPAAASGPENSASARVARGSEPQNAQPTVERVTESSEKQTGSPAKIERPQEAGKQILREAQPPTPARETSGAPEMPKQARIGNESQVAPSKQAVVGNKPETVMGETSAHEGKAAQEKSAQSPERTPPAKPVEQPANKIAPPQAAPIQEAMLRKDLAQEVAGQVRDTGSVREAPQKSSETPAGNSVPEQGQAGGPASAALSKPTVLESKPDRIVDVPPPSPKPESSQAPAVPGQGQIDKSANPTQTKPTPLGNKPEAVMDEKAQETKEARGKSTQIVELARAVKPENIEPVKPAVQAKPAEAATGVRVALKSVEGYAVQLSFPQKIDAQRWSETLAREGYTTSITSVGEADSVRLRVGSFSSPEAAKTLLGRLQKQGLTGFVIQVPKG